MLRCAPLRHATVTTRGAHPQTGILISSATSSLKPTAVGRAGWCPSTRPAWRLLGPRRDLVTDPPLPTSPVQPALRHHQIAKHASTCRAKDSPSPPHAGWQETEAVLHLNLSVHDDAALPARKIWKRGCAAVRGRISGQTEMQVHELPVGFPQDHQKSWTLPQVGWREYGGR